MTFVVGKLSADELNEFADLVTPLTAVKTADEIVNGSNTPQNDDELFVSVAASRVYKVAGLIEFTSGATPNFRFTWSLPASSTHITNTRIYSRASAAPSQLVDTRTFTTGNSGASGLGTTRTTQGQIIELYGYIWTSVTAGTAQFQWSQNTSNASDTTVYAGSFIQLERLA